MANLLEAYRRFKRMLVGRVQPVDQRLLMLLGTPHLGQPLLERCVHSDARVRKAQGLDSMPFIRMTRTLVNASSTSLLYGS